MNRRVFIQVDRIVNQNVPIPMIFKISMSESQYYEINLNSNILRLRLKLESDLKNQTLSEIIYREDTHKFWQFRVEENVLYAEVGASLQELELIGSDQLDSPEKVQIVESSGLIISVGHQKIDVANPGEAHFGNLNIGDDYCLQ